MRARKRINGVEIDVIVDTIEPVIGRDGVCHPAQLVDLSRPEDSPTHPLFEWDDLIAAEAHRVEQARRIIRMIPKPTIEGEASSVPRYVHIRTVTDDGVIRDGYAPTIKVMRGESREAVLRDALGLLKGLQARYENLSDLAPIWRAVEEVESGLEAGVL